MLNRKARRALERQQLSRAGHTNQQSVESHNARQQPVHSINEKKESVVSANTIFSNWDEENKHKFLTNSYKKELENDIQNFFDEIESRTHLSRNFNVKMFFLITGVIVAFLMVADLIHTVNYTTPAKGEIQDKVKIYMGVIFSLIILKTVLGKFYNYDFSTAVENSGARADGKLFQEIQKFYQTVISHIPNIEKNLYYENTLYKTRANIRKISVELQNFKETAAEEVKKIKHMYIDLYKFHPLSADLVAHDKSIKRFRNILRLLNKGLADGTTKKVVLESIAITVLQAIKRGPSNPEELWNIYNLFHKNNPTIKEYLRATALIKDINDLFPPHVKDEFLNLLHKPNSELREDYKERLKTLYIALCNKTTDLLKTDFKKIRLSK